MSKKITIFLCLGSLLALAPRAVADASLGAYQTVAGVAVEEWGDRVQGGHRVVPLLVTLRFDFNTEQPRLTGWINNVVLEGGDPFPLTIHSSSGQKVAESAYRFQGDYLGDVQPLGTQYLFDWHFAISTNGNIVWNGTTGWAGGHIWYLTISNITLVPIPWLNLSRVANGALEIAWMTNFSNHVLECSTNLAVNGWETITNIPIQFNDRLSVMLQDAEAARFYRLRNP